jgi:uncharacterized Zn-finger protein
LECSLKFEAPSKYKRHLLVHSNALEFECICSRKYKSKDNLKRHQKKCQIYKAEERDDFEKDSNPIVESPKKKQHKCTECEKTFYSASNLNRHKTTHLPKEYLCPQCPQVFTKWSLLQKHRKQIHKFECKICRMVLNSQDNLKRHLRIHDQNRPLYECEICLRIFKSANSKRVHVMTVHLGERPYECSCGKTFGHKHLLQRHKTNVHKDVDKAVVNDHGLQLENNASEVKNEILQDTESNDFTKMLTGYDYKRQSISRPIGCYFGGCPLKFTRIYDLERHIESAH